MRAVRREGHARRGQVAIELLLVLPMFLLLIFSVFEVGHLAIRAALLHHVAYEAARMGSLTAAGKASAACIPPVIDPDKIAATAHKALPNVDVDAYSVATLVDPQEGCTNYDVVVRLEECVPLAFPGTGLILANTKKKRCRLMAASVRMPIERPLYK